MLITRPKLRGEFLHKSGRPQKTDTSPQTVSPPGASIWKILTNLPQQICHGDWKATSTFEKAPAKGPIYVLKERWLRGNLPGSEDCSDAQEREGAQEWQLS